MKNKKLNSTLQLSQAECGLCCIRTILSYYSYDITVPELRKIKEPGRDGLGLKQIKSLLSVFNISSEVLKIKDLRAFQIVDLPAIAFWKGYHFVCVEKVNENNVIIMDPSIGRIKISKKEFDENFDSYLIISKPNKNFKSRNTKFWSKWKKRHIWPPNLFNIYIKLGILSIILVFITLSIPIITQILIDTGFNGPLSFFIIIASLSISAAISTILSFARSIFSIKMVYKFSWYLMDNAFRRLLFLPAKYFTVRSPGEIIYRLNALTRIQDVLGSVLVQAILDFISGTALLIYVFWVSPTVGFITLVILTINFIFLVISQKYINAAKDKELHEGSEAQSIQLDALVSINSVKLGGYTETYIKDWESKYQKLLNAMTFRMKLQDGLVRSVLSSTQTFAPVFILAINLYLVKLEIMTLGQAIAIQAIVSLLFSYTNSIFSTISETLMSLKYIELADDIFEYPTEEYSKSSSHLLKSGNISLQNITFSYTPDSSAAIKDVNLDIYEEETVALVGVSGSGKTTLGKIISTLFKPSDGLLYYDDIEDNKYNINILRESISYIPQEANLHNRTIMENLKLGCNNTEIEIKTFCDNLGFLDFINELPMGYNTVVSEMGANLSGGQRQRIHIAKVLLQNPKILVMDEATSSLDNISQSKVYEALDNLQCTKVVIAHRLDTVLNANRIIVLDKGEIVETGTHLELISKRGLYYYLFNTNIKEEF